MLRNKNAVVMEPLPQTEDLYAEWDDDGSETGERLETSYRKYVFRKIAFILICVIVCILVAGFSITIGDYPIGMLEAYQILWDHITGNPDVIGTIEDRVVWQLRLPRILIALIAGAGLAVAGAAMQSTLKNPLADPYTTGISSGAAFGATIAICYGAGIASGNAAIVINAFVFALIPTAIIVIISATKKVSPVSMIMAGIAVMYIFNALTTVLKLWADPDDLSAVYKWQVGSFEGLYWDDVPVMFVVTLIGSIFILLISNKLNVLAAGDESAKSMGIDASKLRIICLIVVSLVTASIVSFTGIIGFVGLVAPHVVRIFIGSDNRYLIPASIAFGAALLLISDLVGRTVISPAVLQVGVVTSFLGGPLFLYLILRQKKEAWRWRYPSRTWTSATGTCRSCTTSISCWTSPGSCA
ncbi:MAG: iron ABC transporter permease [Thermoplasmata archaeon]|nr:iron ABC transporter permease [Thermoplasmata archaeon]